MKLYRITKPRLSIHPFLAVLALLALLLTAASLAETDAFVLSWWTVDSGGRTSQGAAYSLDGSIGQPDPGPALSGGNFILQGGFWGAAETGVSYRYIYLPLVRK